MEVAQRPDARAVVGLESPDLDILVGVFAVWYAPGAPRDATTLVPILGGNGEGARFFADLDSWLRADARVWVIRGEGGAGIPGDAAWTPRGLAGEVLEGIHSSDEASRFSVLRDRRLLGFGPDAARLLFALGLQTDQAASFRRERNEIVTVAGSLVPSEAAGRRFVAYDACALEGGRSTWTCKAMHLPTWSPRTRRTEILARWAGDLHYAPIVRQGNFVWSGIAADARTWTPDLRGFVRQVAGALARRALEPFTLPEWDVTPSGDHGVCLAPCGALDRPYCEERFFRFSEPCLFSARLELETGRQVMLFVESETGCVGGERRDSEQGEPVQVLVPITRRSLIANRGRYWTLELTNFGDAEARGRLTVSCDLEGVIRLPGEPPFPVGSPPSDPETIARWTGLLSSADAGVRLDAERALLAVGVPALGPLRRALDAVVEGERRERREGALPRDLFDPARSRVFLTGLRRRLVRLLAVIEEHWGVEEDPDGRI